MGWQFALAGAVSARQGERLVARLTGCYGSRYCDRPLSLVGIRSEIDMQLVAVLVFLLAFSPSTALAQEIPEYDSGAHCKRVAESAAKPSSTVGRCLWLEEYALDELEAFWPRASKAVREECLEVASAEESYVALARCVMARLRRSR